jgi:hypothetical protein
MKKNTILLLLVQFLFVFSVQSQEVKKKVVIEGYVTSPAIYGGFTPRAYQTFAQFGDRNSLDDYEIIIIHGNCNNCSGADFDTIDDGMYLEDYSAGMNSIGANGFPNVSLDRHPAVGVPYTDDFQNNYNVYTLREPDANVDVIANYDPSTRELRVSANIDFVNSTKNYRLALALTEHNVHRIDDVEYSQWNFFSPYWDGVNGNGTIEDSVAAYGVEYWKRNPYVASIYVKHPHVARAILPSFEGDPASLPESTEAGVTYNHEFDTYIVPDDYRPEMMRAVVLLIADGGLINNANGAWVNGNPASIKSSFVENDLLIYPNPAKNRLTVNSKILNIDSYRISNAIGETVLIGDYNNSAINIESLSAGSYFIILTDKNSKLTYHKKFIK